ncbi:MAG: tetratricopeptide repeat-containing sensor histidine kinase [Bacteroidia bacterium]|nr:tetratricopeptide repeat-containing sensor histidine kinase [Bacteroidia bacterium]
MQEKSEERVNTLNSLCWEYYRKDNGLDSALLFGTNAFEESKAIRFDTGLVQSTNLIGLSYNKHAEKDSAIKYFLKSVEYARKFRIESVAGWAFINLGRIYIYKKDYVKSLVALDSARAVFEKQAGPDNTYLIGIQMVNINKAHVYQRIRNYNEALTYYKGNLEFYSNIPSESSNARFRREGLAYSYQNIGEAYSGLGKSDSAILYYKKSIVLKDIIKKQKREQLNSFFRLAMEFLKKSSPDSAKFYLDIARDSVKSMASLANEKVQESADIYLGYGIYFNEIGNYREGKKYLDSALVVINIHDYNDIRDITYYRVANAYKNLGDWENALKYLEKRDSMNQILIDENYDVNNQILKNEQESRQRELASIQRENEAQRRNLLIRGGAVLLILLIGIVASIYVARIRNKAKEILERKNKEIEDQNTALEVMADEVLKRNDEIETSNIQLERLDGFKNEMIQRIYHDLRTPIYSIIESSKVDNLPENQVVLNMESINRAGRRILSLAESILELERQKDDTLSLKLENLAVFGVVQEALDQVFYISSVRINVANYVSPSYIARFDRNYILWVMVNLLANAESAVEERMTGEGDHEGYVEVICEEDEANDKLWIKIKDSGNGIDLENPMDIFDRGKLNKLGKRQAPRRLRSTGMGLAFVKKALEDHGQEIKVTSKVGAGTTFAFSLNWVRIDIDEQPLEVTEINEMLIELNEEEKQWAYALIKQLKAIPFYSYTRLEDLIKASDTHGSKALDAWCDEALEALSNQNKAKFDRLMEVVN